MIARARSGGMSARFCSMGRGRSLMCLTSIIGVFGAVKGSSPESIWYPTMPSEYRSLRPSISRSPAHCSGLMNAGVPIAVPVAVSRESLPCVIARAMPKSVTIARPLSLSRRMLSGLMSRWMTPRA